MGRWSALAERLASSNEQVRLTWGELEELVGELPASARNHRAWWSGDRPHVRTWQSAGFRLDRLSPGQFVEFAPTGELTPPRPQARPVRTSSPATGRADVLLVTCVKQKRNTPALARALYTSALFRKQAQYAEDSGLPWFILSAEHGLLAPDEWVAPYERYLPATSSTYRRAWGRRVVEQLDRVAGPLRGLTVEVHAGRIYLDAIHSPLRAEGASVLDPLAGLTLGQRLSWYGRCASDDPPESDLGAQAPPPRRTPPGVVADIVAQLSDQARAVAPNVFLSRGPNGLDVPGLYSWWADADGAAELTMGLGHHVPPGLVYAGLAGATRWPSGRPSANTLWSRISGMHFGKKQRFSTLRLTLAAILASARGATSVDEGDLTEWMRRRLMILAQPVRDPDLLGRLEKEVLAEIDPPLNLQGMASTPTRRTLRELRAFLRAGGSVS